MIYLYVLVYMIDGEKSTRKGGKDNWVGTRKASDLDKKIV